MYKRGKRKHISNYNFIDIYKTAVSKYDIKLSKEEFTEAYDLIIDAIFKIVIDEVCEYNLPHKLGTFRVKRCKSNILLDENNKVITTNLKVNFNASKKLWRKKYPDKTWEEIKNISDKPLVYFLNKHTNGYYNKFYWDKRSCMVKNQSIYTLTIVRDKTKKLSEYSKLNKIYYE